MLRYDSAMVSDRRQNQQSLKWRSLSKIVYYGPSIGNDIKYAQLYNDANFPNKIFVYQFKI